MLRPILSPFLGLLLVRGTLAAVVDTDVGAAPQSTLTYTTNVVSTVTSTVVFGPSPTSCDARYCDTDSTMYCVYWGGFSTFDASQHRPIPGETRTAYALCGKTTETTSTPDASTPATATPTATEP